MQEKTSKISKITTTFIFAAIFFGFCNLIDLLIAKTQLAQQQDNNQTAIANYSPFSAKMSINIQTKEQKSADLNMRIKVDENAAMYLKLKNITDFFKNLGDEEYGKQLKTINNNWLFVDIWNEESQETISEAYTEFFRTFIENSENADTRTNFATSFNYEDLKVTVNVEYLDEEFSIPEEYQNIEEVLLREQ